MNDADRWLLHFGSPAGARVDLFCFPYAGGSPAIFQPWKAALPATIHLVGVQWPGRGTLLGVPPFRQVIPLVQEIAGILRPELRRPFVFFGHSLGSLIAFELARELRSRSDISPVHLIVSGRRAPKMGKRKPLTHQLPDSAFISELQRLNGCPPGVLSNPELLKLFLPVLRADFEMDETYIYATATPLECPITAFGGARDPGVSPSDLRTWQCETSAQFSMRTFSGDHFFIQNARKQVIETVFNEISYVL